MGTVIEERTKQPLTTYLHYLAEFVQEHFSQEIIDQDINYLLDRLEPLLLEFLGQAPA